jgi:mercuric ion binding protein
MVAGSPVEFWRSPSSNLPLRTFTMCTSPHRKCYFRVEIVTAAKVDFDKKTASISFDPDKASLPALTKATADVGYPSSVHN